MTRLSIYFVQTNSFHVAALDSAHVERSTSAVGLVWTSVDGDVPVLEEGVLE